MTGPDHYDLAEQLLSVSDDVTVKPDVRAEHVARAQVHATLALAAAIGLSADVPDSREWRRVAGPDSGT